MQEGRGASQGETAAGDPGPASWRRWPCSSARGRCGGSTLRGNGPAWQRASVCPKDASAGSAGMVGEMRLSESSQVNCRGGHGPTTQVSSRAYEWKCRKVKERAPPRGPGCSGALCWPDPGVTAGPHGPHALEVVRASAGPGFTTAGPSQRRKVFLWTRGSPSGAGRPS